LKNDVANLFHSLCDDKIIIVDHIRMAVVIKCRDAAGNLFRGFELAGDFVPLSVGRDFAADITERFNLCLPILLYEIVNRKITFGLRKLPDLYCSLTNGFRRVLQKF